MVKIRVKNKLLPRKLGMSGVLSKSAIIDADPSHLTYNEVESFVKKTILPICQGILERAGPFHKEGLYQSLLMHELRKINLNVIKEMPFAMSFLDSSGNKVYVGENQSLRTDIELIDMKGLLELKSTHSTFKDENIWQLKNYLDQRQDRYWGAAINFISRYNTTSCPQVEIAFMYKIDNQTFDKEFEIQRDLIPNMTVDPTCQDHLIHNGNKMVRYWFEADIYSQELPDQSELFFDYEECFKDPIKSSQEKISSISFNTEKLNNL